MLKKIFNYTAFLVIFSLVLATPLAVLAQEVKPTEPALPNTSVPQLEAMPVEAIPPVEMRPVEEEKPVDPQELRKVLSEIQNIQKELTNLKTQLKKISGAEELLSTVNNLLSQATEHYNNIKGASADTQRETLNDFYEARLWDEINDIRQQFVDPKEIKNAIQDIKRMQTELKRFQKQLAKVAGSDELKQLVNDLLSQSGVLADGIIKAPAGEQREALQNFYDARLWDEINDIRQQFVDPKEIKNAIRDIKRMQTELKRFKKQLAKIPGSDNSQQLVAELLSQSGALAEGINKAPFGEQREALQAFYDTQLWESINQIRARVELPKELKNIARDLKIVQKMPNQKTYQKTGVDLEKLKANIEQIAVIYELIKSTMEQGDWDAAWEILEEEVHQGGLHPGEVRHTMDRLRDIQQKLKQIKDPDIKAQVGEILGAIIETFNEGDFRGAREAVDQFLQQAQSMETYLRRYVSGQKEQDDEKMVEMMEKLEEIVSQKLKKIEPQMGPEGEGQEMRTGPSEEEMKKMEKQSQAQEKKMLAKLNTLAVLLKVVKPKLDELVKDGVTLSAELQEGVANTLAALGSPSAVAQR